jgi:hypothetical protein
MSGVAMISCTAASGCLAVGNGGELLRLGPTESEWRRDAATLGDNALVLGETCRDEGCLVAYSDGGPLGPGRVMSVVGIDSTGPPSSPTEVAAPSGQVFSSPVGNALSCSVDGSFCLLLTAGRPEASGATPTVTWATGGSGGRARPVLREVSVDPHSPTAPGPPVEPACARSMVCLAIGLGGLFSTSDGGRSWHWQSEVSNEWSAVACGGPDTCAIGTGWGAVYFTNASGRQARQTIIPDWECSTEVCTRGYSVSHIACWSSSSCIVSGTPFRGTGDVMDVTTDAGRTWWSMDLPGPVSISGISCESAYRCWAVGSSASDTALVMQLNGP